MKQTIWTLLTLLICGTLSAQDFAPVGAEWYYTERFFQPDIDYLEIHSVKDTLVKGKNCRELHCDHVCWELSGVQYIYSSNDSVFFYDIKLDTFQLLYSFSAIKNDFWNILIKSYDDTVDTLTVNVDSTYITVINGEELRAYKVTYYIKEYSEGYDYSYTSTVVEKLGDINYLFNIPESIGVACDENYPDGLRCYEDEEYGFYSTGIAESCDYTYKWTDINNKESDLNISLYPNPTDRFIDISIPSEELINAELYDLIGNKIKTTTFTSYLQIDLMDFKSGLYILTLKSKNKIIGKNKILKK